MKVNALPIEARTVIRALPPDLHATIATVAAIARTHAAVAPVHAAITGAPARPPFPRGLAALDEIAHRIAEVEARALHPLAIIEISEP